MINFIAVFVCTVGATLQLIEGNWVWCIVEALLAIINLPFAIEWITES